MTFPLPDGYPFRARVGAANPYTLEPLLDHSPERSLRAKGHHVIVGVLIRNGIHLEDPAQFINAFRSAVPPVETEWLIAALRPRDGFREDLALWNKLRVIDMPAVLGEPEENGDRVIAGVAIDSRVIAMRWPQIREALPDDELLFAVRMPCAEFFACTHRLIPALQELGQIYLLDEGAEYLLG
jgi:hypothetical protein